MMMDHFERKTKPLFSNSSTRGCYIPTGIQKVDDEKLNIKKGRLLLSLSANHGICFLNMLLY